MSDYPRIKVQVLTDQGMRTVDCIRSATPGLVVNERIADSVEDGEGGWSVTHPISGLDLGCYFATPEEALTFCKLAAGGIVNWHLPWPEDSYFRQAASAQVMSALVTARNVHKILRGEKPDMQQDGRPHMPET